MSSPEFDTGFLGAAQPGQEEPEDADLVPYLLRLRALEIAATLYDREPIPLVPITETAQMFYDWLLGVQEEHG